jgi:predicted ATP-grasp superfamily ATP-dependent carboligase
MKTPHSCKRDDWKGVPPVQNTNIYQNKKIAIVGYSVRNLNFVAKYAGFKTLAIDCFADMDLRRLADNFIHVNLDHFRDSDGNLDKSAAFYLSQQIDSLSNLHTYDVLISGSSFENDIQAWGKISNQPNFLGNEPVIAQRVRNHDKL